jgi:hypothetical protein
MMMTSLVAMSGSVVAQRFHGTGNPYAKQALLTTVAACPLLLGFTIVYLTKEMYAKAHLMTMHSHWGAMMIFSLLTYTLSSHVIFHPTLIKNKGLQERWQKYHYRFGKVTICLGLLAVLNGIFELERSPLYQVLWMGSVLAFVPLLMA